MEWYKGGVGEAIAEAKSKKSIFAVIIKGKSDDESTQAMEKVFNEEEVVIAFSGMICISIETESTTFAQFSSIYPVLLVPSVYFIDSGTGVDLEITGGVVTKSMLLSSVQKATERFHSSHAEANTNVESDQKQSSARETKPESCTTEETNVVAQDTSLEERVERAKLLMAKRQSEREEQEKEKEKQKEMERREVGKALLERKRKQEEQEVKEAALARKKDKEEEKKAKEAVKAAIEQDRLDRKMKYDAEKKANEEKRVEKEKEMLAQQAALAEITAAERATIARLQFRLPDGRSQTKQFPAETTLSSVYDFVSTGLETKFSSFSLSTTFPRKMLDDEDKNKTLKDLQMAPSSTVLVLPLGGIVSSQDGGLMSMIWMILTPFTLLWSVLTSFFATGPQQSHQMESQSTRTRGREGGIGRINNDNRDPGENNTWNGNSTQQQ